MSTGLISKKHNNPKNKEEDRKMHKAEHQSYNNFKKEAPRDVRECSTPENFQLHSLQLDQIKTMWNRIPKYHHSYDNQIAPSKQAI